MAESTKLEDLLSGVGAGDVDAFTAIYDHLAPRVHGLVVRVLRDAHQAEEVTQEVFLQVWRTASRFDPARGSAHSWVLTLAHRRAVDRVRSSESTRRRDARDFLLSGGTPWDQTADVALATLEAGRVGAALATLPQGQRDAIVLAYMGGHTHTEVSELMQIPLGTAKTRIRDGLIRLRDRLAVGVTQPA
jgi:RNA polymerase sigma-70 factor (ECF subfamily)